MKALLFRDIPLKQRLRRVITLTSAITLSLACVTIVGYQFVSARLAAVHDLTTLADAIASNCRTALAFQDAEAARAVLATLKTNPEILAGRIYGNDGQLFAQYVMSGKNVPPLPPTQRVEGHWFQEGQLILVRPIRLNNEIVGTISLCSDVSEQYERLRDYVIIVAILMLVSTCVAFLLAAKLQDVISRPILALVDVVRGVATKKDYSLRVPGKSEGEVGQLIDAFNQMLDRIRERDDTLRTTYAELEKRSGELNAELAERKRAEDQLRESEERFRQLAESINEVFWMTNAEKTQMVYISPAYEQIWGRTCESLYKAPMTWVDAIHPDDRARVIRAALGKQANGTYDEEYRILRPSGTVRWIRDRAFPIVDEQGKTYRIAGIAEDITQQKSAEQALQMQARVLENMVEGVLVYDENDRILFTNPALDVMFGYARGELIGKSTFVLNPFPAETCAEIAERIRNHLKSHKSLDHQFQNRRKDGSEFISESRLSKLEIDGQWCQVAVVQDVTERRRMEKEVLEVSDREQRRIGQDLHDGLCQLLTGTAFAGGVLEELLAGKSLPEAGQAAKLVALLESATAEARRVVRGLHPVQLEAGGLASALEELARSEQNLFGIPCECVCPDPVPIQDTATATHVYRIAQEAVNNAVRHSGAKQITINLSERDDTVTLAVTDDGVGLSEKNSNGAGMGLSIMAYRAKMIGGTFQVARRAKGGTQVLCSFTIDKEALNEAAVQQEDIGADY